MAQAEIIMQDDFNDGVLTGWDVDLSPSAAAVDETAGYVVFFAHANTFAHIERDNSHDNITAKAQVRVDDTNTGSLWAPGIVLYWRANDWARIALDGKDKSVFMSCMIDGAYSWSGYDRLSDPSFYSTYIWLAIKLTDTYLSFYVKSGADSWRRIGYRPRPSAFSGAPAKIILGKGYGTGAKPLHSPDLDNDYSMLGDLGIFRIDDFSVTVNEVLAEVPFLRKFPYPYGAALTITYDVDGMSSREFMALHQFLNTKQDMSLNLKDEGTRSMGVGVGLEISDSFWMFNDDGGAEGVDGMSYFRFDGTNVTKTADADVIRTYSHAGYLDCLHSFGHFGSTGAFTRELAILALDEMERAGIRPVVWSNHGDGFDTDNIGHRWNPLNLGDVPGSEAYHCDLSVFPNGPFKFLWKFLPDGVVDEPLQEVLVKQELFDGRDIITFARYYGPGWLMENLADQLSREALDELLAAEGYMIVANHLNARGYPIPVYFDSRTRDALRRLESEHRDGEIYVTTTAKLLRYKLAYNKLEWTSYGDCDLGVEIHIEGIDDPLGGMVTPTREDLQGITFCVPCASDTRVYLDNVDVTDELQLNPEDGLAVESLSFPLSHLPPFPEWISDGYTSKTEDYEAPYYDYTIEVINIGATPLAAKLKYVGLHEFSVSSVKHGPFYNIHVPDSATVKLPTLGLEESTGPIEIVNGGYREDLPRLEHAICDSCEVQWAMYDPENNTTSIALAGRGPTTLSLENLPRPFLGVSCSIGDAASQTVNLELQGAMTIETVNMDVTPSAGEVTIAVDEWETAEYCHCRWRQRSVHGAESVEYRIGGLCPDAYYAVYGAPSCREPLVADCDGCISIKVGCDDSERKVELTDLTGPGRREFWLTQSSPNPFHPGIHGQTLAFFAAPQSGRATVKAFDAAGRLIAVLYDGPATPGIHRVGWHGRGGDGELVPTGIYLLTLELAGRTQARKVILLR